MAQQFTLAEAFIEFRAKGLNVLERSLGNVRRVASAATGALSKMARTIKDLFTGKLALLGGLGIAAIGVKLLAMAANAEEARAKLRAVFGASGDDAIKWANDLAASIGRGRQDMQSFLTTAQSTFTAAGFAAEDALGLSKIVTRLTLDIAAFQNVAEPDVLQSLKGALVGSRLAMRRLDVTINEARLQAALLKFEFKGTWQEATEMQKQIAILRLILDQTAKASGQASRESGGLMGQWRRFTGVVKDLGAALGSILAPAAIELLQLFSDVAGIIEANRETFKKWGEAIGAAVRKVTEPLKLFANILGNDFSAAWEIVKSAFSIGFAWIEERVKTLIDWMLAAVLHAAQQAGKIIAEALPFGKEFTPTPFEFGKEDISPATKEAQKKLSAAQEKLADQLAAGKAGLPQLGGAAGKPVDVDELLRRLWGEAGGAIMEKAQKKKKEPGFEFASFAGLWKATQQKLGKEEEKLVKLAEKDAVVQNDILKALEDVPLARWT